jgi:DeoR/GlpR family transcriptional regulator of sugar metabolism
MHDEACEAVRSNDKGLDSEGCWTTELTEAEIKKTIITRSRRCIILADQRKWKAPGNVLFSACDAINDLVLDRLPEEAAHPLPVAVAMHQGRS